MIKKFAFSFCCDCAAPDDIIIQIELLNSRSLTNENSVLTYIGATTRGGRSSAGVSAHPSNETNPFNLALYYFYVFVDVGQGSIDPTKDFLYILESNEDVPMHLKECDQSRM